MLNNNLLFSIIFSSISTSLIYLTTNRSKTTKETLYTNKDISIIFLINFCSCCLLNHLRKGEMFSKKTSNTNLNSSDTILTHSSRPPF